MLCHLFVVNGAVCQTCSVSVQAINTAAAWRAMNKQILSAVASLREGFGFRSGPKLCQVFPVSGRRLIVPTYSLICQKNGRNEAQLLPSGLASRFFSRSGFVCKLASVRPPPSDCLFCVCFFFVNQMDVERSRSTVHYERGISALGFACLAWRAQRVTR